MLNICIYIRDILLHKKLYPNRLTMLSMLLHSSDRDVFISYARFALITGSNNLGQAIRAKFCNDTSCCYTYENDYFFKITKR